MKRDSVILVLCGLWLMNTAKGQAAEEWTEQNKTQIKYLVEQVIALKNYGKIVVEGYELAQQGLGIINDIKNRDYNLHMGYLNSLKAINPSIRDHNFLKEILLLQRNITAECLKNRKLLSVAHLSLEEKAYIGLVVQKLLDKGKDLIVELKNLMSENAYHMKDNERIKRIQELHDEMMNQFVFINHFTSEVKQLYFSRTGEIKEIDIMKNLQGVK